MAKVLLTRMNFTSVIKEKIDDMGFEGLFASAILGGKDKMKEALGDLPDEQKIYVDTNYVMTVTSLIKVSEVNEIIFQITLASPIKDGQQTINIKGEEYEDFIKVWRGQQEWLSPGTYKVGFGQNCNQEWAKPVNHKMWAEVSDDGLTVTVKEAKPV